MTDTANLRQQAQHIHDRALIHHDDLNARREKAELRDFFLEHDSAVITSVLKHDLSKYVDGLDLTRMRFISINEYLESLARNDGFETVNDFLDWFTHDSVGIDAPGFLEAGHEQFEDAMRDKQIDALHFFFQRTENTFTNGVLDNASGCLFRTKWDWADTAASNKWSDQEQAYKF